MNICKIVDGDYPWDVRVEKICDTLIEAGHDVFLVSRNVRRQPLHEYYKGIHIFRLPHLPRFMGKLNYYATFPAFFSPLWIARVQQVVRANSIDCIMVRDLPLALTAAVVGKLNCMPVILDMAECYPEMLRTLWQFGGGGVTDLVVRNPSMAGLVEKLAVKDVDHVLVVVEESMKRLLELGVSPKKISIVSNTPNLNEFSKRPPTFPGSTRFRKDTLVMLYVGLLSMARGLDFVIQALPTLIRKHPNVTVVIVGRGKAQARLQKLAKELNVEEHVYFEGYVDRELVPQYIASSDVGIIPYPYCSHWAHTIPNKLFDYMAMSKPVLVSDIEPMKRIVSETRSGVIFQSSRIDSFCRAVGILLDERSRRKMGENGEKAVRERYNWDVDAAQLLDVLEGCRMQT
jgi:glycosyltransferase involved in cell wall biosynthesis